MRHYEPAFARLVAGPSGTAVVRRSLALGVAALLTGLVALAALSGPPGGQARPPSRPAAVTLPTGDPGPTLTDLMRENDRQAAELNREFDRLAAEVRTKGFPGKVPAKEAPNP